MRILVLITIVIGLYAFSAPAKGWHHLDPGEDQLMGISSNKAYEYLEGRSADTVIVAIIDNGTDINHEDLHGMIWINEDEIAGNGIDDDGNGYTDDIHGWNFLGNAEGKSLKLENLEMVRMYGYLHGKYAKLGRDDITPEQADEFELYREIRDMYDEEVEKVSERIESISNLLERYEEVDEILSEQLGEDYTEKQVRKIKRGKTRLLSARDFRIEFYDYNLNPEMLEKEVENGEHTLATRLNPDYSNRQDIVGDDPHNMLDTIYGNPIVDARGPSHGTAVSGVVAARNNSYGIDGIARHVQLMILRVVPNGDERDKDVARAILYAARNGADIINCSFGKMYSRHPEVVQAAINEAGKLGVLVVNGAGNDANNNDLKPWYPTGMNADGTKAPNVITVGASRADDEKGLVASFSNYGKRSVDIFAPGVEIKSCALKDNYEMSSGTSIASPVVAGIAAVLKSYFPHLDCFQLKEIIMRSAYIPSTKMVRVPGDDSELREFSELSVSGGIANLYRAVKLADEEYSD